MKKFLLMLFAFAVPMALVSCSDDDDDNGKGGGEEEEEVILADKAAGTYLGSYSLEVMGNPVEGGITVNLTKTDDEEVTVKFSTLEVPVLGQLAIADIKEVALSGTEASIKLEAEGDELVIDSQAGDMKVAYELSGTVANANDLTLTVTLTSEDGVIAAVSPLKITIDVAKDGKLPDPGPGEVEGDLADDAEGTYLGSFSTTVFGMEYSGGVTVDLTKTGENEVSMGISTINVMGMSIDIPELEGIALSDEDGDGVIVVEATIEDVEIMGSATSLTISGTITDANNLVMNVAIEGILPMAINISVDVAKDGQLPDPGDEGDDTLADVAEGTYTGVYSVAELGGEENAMEITVIKTGDDEITLSFGDISFGDVATASIPDITAISLSGDEESITIVDKEITSSLSVSIMPSIPIPATIKLSGSITDGADIELKVVVSSNILAAMELSPLTIDISASK